VRERVGRRHRKPSQPVTRSLTVAARLGARPHLLGCLGEGGEMSDAYKSAFRIPQLVGVPSSGQVSDRPETLDRKVSKGCESTGFEETCRSGERRGQETLAEHIRAKYGCSINLLGYRPRSAPEQVRASSGTVPIRRGAQPTGGHGSSLRRSHSPAISGRLSVPAAFAANDSGAGDDRPAGTEYLPSVPPVSVLLVLTRSGSAKSGSSHYGLPVEGNPSLPSNCGSTKPPVGIGRWAREGRLGREA